MICFFRGSETAISAATERYSNYCHSISYNILHSNEDADECVNDTFLRAWNAIPPTRPNNLAVFLGTIVRRLSLNRYKKNNTKKRGSGQIYIALSELEEAIPDKSLDLEGKMDDKNIVNVLNRFLAGLPQEQRNVFVRRYWHLRIMEEISDDYGISVNNIKQILYRTRKKLKKALEEEGITI